MKIFTLVILSCLILNCGNSKGQNSVKRKILKIEGVPELTYKQMLEDHDSLISYIKQVSPIIYFNKEVRGIDFKKHANKLHEQISKKTTVPEYLNIVQRTINAAQDEHTTIVWPELADVIKKHWIPENIKVVGYDSLAFNYVKKYSDYLDQAFNTKLNLDLVYTSGEYYNILPFSYAGKKFPASMKLVNCNEENVHEFVKGMIELTPGLRWDRALNKAYYEKFYKSSFIYKEDSLSLDFLDEKNVKHRLKIAKQDSVTFLEKINNKFGYNMNINSMTSHYFKKERIFYAKLPLMKEQLGDSLSNRLKLLIKTNPVDAIIIDIRGNGGGNDMTYSNFLKKILKKPLQLDLKVGRNFSSINQNYYEINKDTILNNTSYSFKIENASSLKEPKMFFITMPEYNFVTPDTVLYPFNGKIYILQDRFIYSSASNLSNLAKQSEQLISIGETQNLLGGLQTSVMPLCLPHSKILFRVEPQIDFTNTKTKADIFQNNVEYPVQYSIDFLYERTTTKEDIFGNDFLYNKDPMFKKVLELEKERKETIN